MRWRLRVTYPTGRDGYYWGELDPWIVKAAGRFEDTRGTVIDGSRRDLEFGFATESAARNARQRVLGLRKKGMRTEVYRA